MLREAALPDARSALFPRANAPEVFAVRIAEKDIGATAAAGLDGLAEQLALEPGQVVESHRVFNLDKEIHILGDGLGRGEGTEQGDAPHACEGAGGPAEVEHGEKPIVGIVDDFPSDDRDPALLPPLFAPDERTPKARSEGGHSHFCEKPIASCGGVSGCAGPR
ncbi:MAG: hypothetical protein K9N23_17535 [Akkermansiaceae bacterium]|nr:hypothetical protein [Akkermansiaceae bacterium]